MPSAIWKIADTNVEAFVLAAMELTGTGEAESSNSGIEIAIEGVFTATEERTASVTFTTQFAASFGLAIDVWPTFEISSPDSSMKIWLFCDISNGCDAGSKLWGSPMDSGRITAKAGLKMPEGTKAGP